MVNTTRVIEQDRTTTVYSHIALQSRWLVIAQQCGSGITATAPVSGVSAPACTNGAWPLLRPVSVVQKNKSSIMSCPHVQYINFPWTAKPDGSGWRDNRLAAQHLPRDLVRPSNGQEQLAQTMKKNRGVSIWSTLRGEKHFNNDPTTTAFTHSHTGNRSCERNEDILTSDFEVNG